MRFYAIILVIILTSCSSGENVTTDPKSAGLCANIDCGPNGQCVVESEIAVCGCDIGYHADALACVADIVQCVDLDQDTYGSNCNNGPDCNDSNSQLYQLLDGFSDQDGDGHGIGQAAQICSGMGLPAGYALDNLDCNDQDPLRWDNCQDLCIDNDQDSHGVNCTAGSDCNDNNNQIYQLLNGYVDQDGDSYGTGTIESVCSGSVLPTGYANNNTDCDDNDNSLWQNCPSPNQSPVASFTVSVSGGTAPLVVSFDASGSSDPDGNIASYTWDFNDGNTATGMTASHTFTQNGSYAVQLTVTDDQQATNTATSTVLVGGDYGKISALPYVMPISSGTLSDLTPGGWKGMEDPATGRFQSLTVFMPGGGIPGVGNGDAFRAILPKGPSYLTDPVNADNQGSAGFGPFELINPTDNVYFGYVIRFNAGIRVGNASRNGSLGVKLLEIQAFPDPMECRAFTYLRVIDTDLGFRPAEDGGTPHAPSLDSTLRVIGDGSPNDIAEEWIYIVHRLNTTTNEHGYSVYRRSGFMEERHYADYPFQCTFTKSDILYAGIGNTWESAINTLSDADASYDLAYVHAWSDEAPDTFPPAGFLY